MQKRGFEGIPYWRSLLASLLIGVGAGTARADDASLLSQLRANLAEKPSSVREGLLPGLYGVYFNNAEPRTFVDGKFNFIGNSSTGYTFLSGPKRGQDLSAQDSQKLFREFVAAIPRNKLISYRFGAGRREVFLITAYDCPNCRALEREFIKQAKTLDATVYLIPTALSYAGDPRAKPLLRSVLCAERPEVAWNELILKGKTPEIGSCANNPDDYAFLTRSFPVRFPISVPTAVTVDGRIYPLVLAKFDEIFRAR